MCLPVVFLEGGFFKSGHIFSPSLVDGFRDIFSQLLAVGYTGLACFGLFVDCTGP